MERRRRTRATITYYERTAAADYDHDDDTMSTLTVFGVNGNTHYRGNNWGYPIGFGEFLLVDQ